MPCLELGLIQLFPLACRNLALLVLGTAQEASSEAEVFCKEAREGYSSRMKYILLTGALVAPILLLVQKIRGKIDVRCCAGACDASRDLRMRSAFTDDL